MKSHKSSPSFPDLTLTCFQGTDTPWASTPAPSIQRSSVRMVSYRISHATTHQQSQHQSQRILPPLLSPSPPRPRPPRPRSRQRRPKSQSQPQLRGLARSFMGPHHPALPALTQTARLQALSIALCLVSVVHTPLRLRRTLSRRSLCVQRPLWLLLLDSLARCSSGQSMVWVR